MALPSLFSSDIVADALASIDEKELEMSPEDLKTMIEDMAKTTLESFQVYPGTHPGDTLQWIKYVFL